MGIVPKSLPERWPPDCLTPSLEAGLGLCLSDTLPAGPHSPKSVGEGDQDLALLRAHVWTPQGACQKTQHQRLPDTLAGRIRTRISFSWAVSIFYFLQDMCCALP